MLSLEFLANLATNHRPDLTSHVSEFSIDTQFLAFNSQPALMGVINLSPDSWYRESVCLTADLAIQRAQVLHAQGAHLIDLGAESTLAHAARADTEQQNNILLPIISTLRELKISSSIETYDPAAARASLHAGAAVLNLTGNEHADEIYREVAAHDAAVIICFVQGRNVRDVGDFDLSRDPIEMLLDYFSRQIGAAQKCGVTKIFLDPGLGFYYRNLQDSSLRVQHQMRVFLNSFRLRSLGFPICNALPHAFEFFGEEVRTAESFFALLAALGKTDLFRTHEIPKVKAVLDTLRSF